MASKIKVDQIEGSTGTTVSLPSGQTLDLSSGSVTLPTSAVDLSTNKVTGTLGSANLPTIPVTKGGTGVTSLGSAGQALKVNSGGNALEFGSVSGGGKVGQVISSQCANERSTTSGSFVDINDFAVTITPSATTSKVLIQGTVLWGRSTNNTMWLQMHRNNTLINAQTFATSSETDGFYASGTNSGYYVLRTAPFSFLDTPNTTSAITYKIKARVDGNTLYFNRIGADTNQAGTSQINAIEILA